MLVLKKVVRLHLYDIEYLLRPRGSLKKESLSLLLLEKLTDNFESWVDPTYGDSLSKEEAFKILKRNYIEETNLALDKLKEKFGIIDDFPEEKESHETINNC